MNLNNNPEISRRQFIIGDAVPAVAGALVVAMGGGEKAPQKDSYNTIYLESVNMDSNGFGIEIFLKMQYYL